MKYGLRVRNLTKMFGKKREVVAIDNASYDLREGEFFTLVGPSGCGKTTTLHSVAGLVTPDKGTIEIGDKMVFSAKGPKEIEVNKEPAERNIGMVFQTYAIYPHMTVRSNISFPLEIAKEDKTVINKKVEKIAEILGIKDLLGRKPAELSGGQRQRVALGRALVIEPKIFLLDEPLANLDAKLRVKMRAELKRLQKGLNITVLYVTHDQAEAMSMSDRIAVMNEGKIEQIGTPMELYNKPQTLFIAGFIGTPPMNILETTLVHEGGVLYFVLGDSKLPVPKPHTPKIKGYVGKKVVLGIRPEDIRIASKKTDFVIRGVVDVIETLGSTRIIHMKNKNIGLVVETKNGSNLKMGDKTFFELDPKKIHIFDKDSGKAITTPLI